MPDSARHKRYLFSGFILDTSRSTLFHGDEEVKLRPQSFDVLQYLLENNGELLSRDALHDAIWAERAVTDDSLAQCMVEIRRALDDSTRTLIRTVPRRGYIFDGEVAVEEPVVAKAGPRQNYSALQGATLFVLLAVTAFFVWYKWLDKPVPHSIAVLPFIDMSEQQDMKHIGDSLAEDILNTLAHRPNLNVIARTSSFAYSTEMRDIESIGDALDVAYVLEGSVRREDKKYRIVAQLIETSDSTHVWSAQFLTSVQDLPEVHEQISRRIWQELRPSSRSAEDVEVLAGISASEQMMLARQYEIAVREKPEVDHESLDRAIDLYRKSTIANPKSAIAFAGLARVLLFKGELDGAKQAINAALQINPDLSDVQEVLARWRWVTAQGGAGEAWKRATELNPGSADAAGSYGYWLWMQGFYDAASEQLYRATKMDPGSLSRYADLGNFLGNEARVEEVDAVIAEIEERFDSAESYRVIARLLDLIGRVDESIGWLIRARDKNPDDPTYDWALAELYVDIGDIETATALEPDPSLGLLLKMRRYDEFIEQAEFAVIDDPNNITVQYLLAFAYNVVGKHELAVRLLDRANVLEMVDPETRHMWDFEAVFTWVDANALLGDAERLGPVIEFIRNYRKTKSANWWGPVYHACTESSAGEYEIALDILLLVNDSPRLPPLYLVKDAGCLRKFHGDPRYEEILRNIRSRQVALREQLPSTLEEFGVSLDKR